MIEFLFIGEAGRCKGPDKRRAERDGSGVQDEGGMAKSKAAAAGSCAEA